MSLVEFLNSSKGNVVPSILTFPPVNIPGITRRLKLKRKGREEGSKNFPLTESEGFDPVESSIIAEISSISKEQYDQYLEQQKTYTERAADTSVRALVLEVSTATENAITNFERQMNTGTDELYARKRELVQTEKALNDFRARHRLDQPPRNYGSKAVKISVLVLLIAIEAVLNGYFLSKGSEFGLIGGVLEAIIIAGINIAVGVAVGHLIAPWIVYRSWIVRIVTACGLVLYLGLAFGWNLGVAHYRTAMADNPFEASIVAYQHLIASPFGIADLQSWSLLVMGFLFSLFAAADGWWLDDPYPGYGDAMRHNLSALENYNSLKKELFDDLDDIKKPAEELVEDATRTLNSRQGEFDNIVMRSAALKAAISEQFDHLEQAANHLLAYYRNENMKHRQTEPPARFSDGVPWQLQRPQLEHQVVSEAGREHYEAALADAFASIPTHLKALHEKYTEAMQRYAKVDTLLASEKSDGAPQNP